MMRAIFILAMFLPATGYATFGMFGRDQCGYPQTQFPINTGDYSNANQQRLNGLQSYRNQLAAKMAKINNDLANAQLVLKAYFPSPWCDAMFAHMDNDFDCCTAGTTTAQVRGLNSRMPAGNDNPDTYVDTVTVQPDQPYNNPDQTQTAPPPDDTTGQSCLQTGFAAGAQWNKYACRNGGEIDPQVCSNATISKSPGDYQKCIDMIKIYHDLAEQKKTLAGQIQDLDAQISPIRADTSGDTGSGGKANGFLSGLGNFLGGVMSVALPFVINQYASYTAKQQMTNMSPAVLGPRQPITPPNAGGRMLYGPTRTGTLGYTQMQPPPPYYGPSYGYGMGYGGQYGQTLPGFQTGGFGCSPGMFGGGMNILSMLMGGMGGGMGGGLGGMLGALLGGGMNGGLSLNANLGGNFGMLGGGAPYAGVQMGYGNSYPMVPPYSMGGFTPPYQPGGIYGGTPTFIPNFNNSTISGYYTGQPIQSVYAPPMNSGCNTCSLPPPPAYGNYLSSGTTSGSNAFYYAQMVNNNQQMMRNQMMISNQEAQLEYQLYQLRMMNNQMGSGTSYYNGSPNGLAQPLMYNTNGMGI